MNSTVTLELQKYSESITSHMSLKSAESIPNFFLSKSRDTFNIAKNYSTCLSMFQVHKGESR